jgi:hypothetical protein
VAGTPLLTREPSLSHDTAAHARKGASAILSTEQTKSLLTPRGSMCVVRGTRHPSSII